MIPMFGSCIFDDYPETENGGISGIDGTKTLFEFNIRPLSVSAETLPLEKIKTARVVVIAKGETAAVPDTVEYNRLLDVTEVPAKDYAYTLRWNSTPGDKDIFVIANEASVDADLSTVLGSYPEGEPARNFVSMINDYSFTPAYEADAQNNIYLPYTFSQEDIRPRPGVMTSVNAWLVPVATKFIFNFTNNRPHAINIKGISMKSANKANYLLGHPTEPTMEYNGEEMSWVDWLAEISKNSWQFPEYGSNSGYNDEVGWIVNYDLPDPDDAEVYTFVKQNDPDENFTVKAAKTEEVDGEEVTTPGKHTTPVYYLPESANFPAPEAVDPDDTDDTGNAGDDTGDGDDEGETVEAEQVYYLTMLFEDTANTGLTAPPFIDIPIPNLKALFRNTYVVINIIMSEGEIEVYAEIADWNRKTANGWVTEGNAPSGNNPFTVRKKW